MCAEQLLVKLPIQRSHKAPIISCDGALLMVVCADIMENGSVMSRYSTQRICSNRMSFSVHATRSLALLIHTTVTAGVIDFMVVHPAADFSRLECHRGVVQSTAVYCSYASSGRTVGCDLIIHCISSSDWRQPE